MSVETMETVALSVKLFGRYRDLGDGAALELSLPAGATVADLVARLHERDSGPLPVRPVVAVNRTPAGDDLVLNPGDEIALIPPVAGG